MLCILLFSTPSFAEDLFAVKVNGEVIALTEFQKIYEPIKGQILSDRKVDPHSPQGIQILVNAKENVLEEMIRYQVLTQAARRMKISVTQQEVDQRIEEIKKNFPSQLAFESSLYEEGINPNDLKQGVTTKILEEKIADLLVGKIVVTPKEIKQYMDKIKRYFVEGQDTAPVTLKPEHVKNFLLAEKKRGIFERWYEETLDATEIEIGSELFSAEEKEIKNKSTRLLPGFS